VLEPCPAQVLRDRRHQGECPEGKPAHDISPVALEVVARIDANFDIERAINGPTAVERLATRSIKGSRFDLLRTTWIC